MPSTTSGIDKSVLAIDVQNQEIELAYWRSVENSKNIAFLNSYVERYLEGQFVFLARGMIQALEANQQSTQAQQDMIVAMVPPHESDTLRAGQHKTCEVHFRANRLTAGLYVEEHIVGGMLGLMFVI